MQTNYVKVLQYATGNSEQSADINTQTYSETHTWSPANEE